MTTPPAQGWSDDEKRRKVHERVLEFMREGGALLIALSPLEFAVSKEIRWPVMFVFISLGVLSLTLAIVTELRFQDVD